MSSGSPAGSPLAWVSRRTELAFRLVSGSTGIFYVEHKANIGLSQQLESSSDSFADFIGRVASWGVGSDCGKSLILVVVFAFEEFSASAAVKQDSQ